MQKEKLNFLKMKEVGKRLSEVFDKFSISFFVGKNTKKIDMEIFDFLESKNLESQAFGYNGFSGYSCISINEELVHGVPKEDVFVKETDLVKIDICAKYDHHCADMARMYARFDLNNLYERMRICGENAIMSAFQNTIENNRIGNISNAVEKEIIKEKFSIVKDFCGHGIGKSMHEDPLIPNYGSIKKGEFISVGRAYAVEPMFCQYRSELEIDKNDKWTAKTKDKGIAAHIEDTIFVTDNGPCILTRL